MISRPACALFYPVSLNLFEDALVARVPGLFSKPRQRKHKLLELNKANPHGVLLRVMLIQKLAEEIDFEPVHRIIRM